MKEITFKKVHHFFKLNGCHLDKEELCEAGYCFIKEGDEYEQEIGEFLLDWFDNKSYVNLQTSGTTGIPKIISVSKQAMVNSALATGDFFDLQPGNKALCCLPVKYIAGKMMLVRSIILGLELDLVSPSSNPLSNNATPYDFVAMVPLQVQNSLAELKRVKKLIIGGAKISKSLELSILNIDAAVYETYGMTETITHIAAKKVGEQAFSILPNVQITQNEKGCLIIDALKITNVSIVTNDLVEILSENQFVFLGRVDNVINSGGLKLIPEQIEEKLSSKIHSRFFVGGIPDAVLGEKLVLVIEGEQQDLDKNLFNTLDKYERPKEVFYISAFNETPNGKIKRKEILGSF